MPAIADRHRIDPAGLVRREILLLEPRDGGDRPRDVSLVERAWAVVGATAERRSELGEAYDLPYLRRRQVLLRHVGAARPGGGGERGDGKAVLRRRWRRRGSG